MSCIISFIRELKSWIRQHLYCYRLFFKKKYFPKHDASKSYEINFVTQQIKMFNIVTVACAASFKRYLQYCFDQNVSIFWLIRIWFSELTSMCLSIVWLLCCCLSGSMVLSSSSKFNFRKSKLWQTITNKPKTYHFSITFILKLFYFWYLKAAANKYE